MFRKLSVRQGSSKCFEILHKHFLFPQKQDLLPERISLVA